jgi:hypothetical protein
MLNPQLRPLFKQLQMCVEKTPVVIYTMRPQLLRYKSAVRRRLVNLRWKDEWHHNDDQVIVPPEVTEASQVIKEYSGIVPLHEQEEQDLTMSFQRLLGTAPPCPHDHPILVLISISSVCATPPVTGRHSRCKASASLPSSDP